MAVWEVNILISPSIATCDYCLSPNLIICQHWLHLGGIGRIYVFSTTTATIQFYILLALHYRKFENFIIYEYIQISQT